MTPWPWLYSLSQITARRWQSWRVAWTLLFTATRFCQWTNVVNTLTDSACDGRRLLMTLGKRPIDFVIRLQLLAVSVTDQRDSFTITCRR